MPLVVPPMNPKPVVADPRITKAISIIGQALRDNRVGSTSRNWFNKVLYELKRPLS